MRFPRSLSHMQRMPLLLIMIVGLFSSAVSGQVDQPLSDVPPEANAIGERAAAPPRTPAIRGAAPERLGDGVPAMLLFVSPYDSGMFNALDEIVKIESQLPDLPLYVIAEGALEDVRTAIQSIGDRPVPNTILADPGQLWRAAYLKPIRRETLPMVVAINDEGLIAWHGPPTTLQMIATPLSTGKWNHTRYRENAIEQTWRKNNAIRLNRARRDARVTGAWDQVIEMFDRIIESDPKNPTYLIDRFECLLIDMKQPERAYAYGRRVAEQFPRDYITLNDLAWRTVSRRDIPVRDYDFALEMSEQANALQGYRDYAVLDTMARIHWMKGDRDLAVKWQRRAAGIAPETWHGDSTRQNLLDYTSGETAPGTLPPPYISPRRTRR